MASQELSSILIDLQKHLKTANVQVANLSTIAQKGDDKELKLVEKFLGESTFVKSGDSLDIATSSHKVLASQFYIACFWGFRDIVKRILDLTDNSEIEFNINAQNDETLWTPLHAATFQEHGPVLMLLLSKGGNPELRDSEGRTSIDFASASGKVWGHFAAQGYRKTPKGDLIEMGIIKKLEVPDNNMGGISPRSPRDPVREPGKGITMAAYSRPEAAYAVDSDPFNQALAGGDVLANDADEQRQNATPQFVAYK